MELHEKLIRLRKQKGMSQLELAEALEVHVDFWNFKTCYTCSGAIYYWDCNSIDNFDNFFVAI